MPKGKSSAKRFEKQERRRLRNRAVRSTVKTYISHARQAISAGAPGADGNAAGETTRAAIVRAISQLDRAARKGVIHPNNAARRKSRLMKLANAAAVGA